MSAQRVTWTSLEGRTVVAYPHDSGQTFLVEHFTTAGQPAISRPLVFASWSQALAAASFIRQSIVSHEERAAAVEPAEVIERRRSNRAANPSDYAYLAGK